MEVARDRVGAGFQRLLVDAVVRVGRERGALAGLEVHDVVAAHAVGADGAALQFLAGLVRFCEKCEIHAEAAIRGFGSGDGLEEQVDGRAGSAAPPTAW